MQLDDSSVSASAVGDGGSVRLRIGNGLRLHRSVLAAFAGGSGGDIDIEPFGLTSPRFVTLDRSAILASAINGNGGDIRIRSTVFLPSFESIIDASSQFGVAGNIAIESPNTNVGGSLVTLPSNPLDAESHLAERCVVRQTGQSSSFTVDTRRPAPAQPGDLLPSDGQ
jgi:large exoprotein involved in heme utilization and adhesion